jgi:hypothetical protein
MNPGRPWKLLQTSILGLIQSDVLLVWQDTKLLFLTQSTTNNCSDDKFSIDLTDVFWIIEHFSLKKFS